MDRLDRVSRKYRRWHVWGAEYGSPEGSSRPPVLCDPSSPPRLVVGNAVRADVRDGDGWMSRKTREDRQTDRQTDRWAVGD